MAPADDHTRAAAELRRLFIGMDAGDEASAVRAMYEAAALLCRHGLSFRQMVQQIEERGLLLPPKVGAAIQLMDSTTLAEATSAFAGARRLMKGCGLTFEHIITALEHGPTETGEIEQIQRAHQAAVEAHQVAMEARQAAVEKAERLEAELRALRSRASASVPMSMFRQIHIPIKGFILTGVLLMTLWLTVSIALTILGMFRSANAESPPPPTKIAEHAVVPTPAPPAPAAARADAPPRAPVADQARTTRSRSPDRDRARKRITAYYWGERDDQDAYGKPFYDPSSRRQFECWRDRGIRGKCFE